jgi:hypothetical protein
MPRSIHIAIIVLCLAAVLPATPVHAYLDPGTGSMILQLLIGGVAGVLIIIKLYWSQLKQFVNGSRKTTGNESAVRSPTESDGDGKRASR